MEARARMQEELATLTERVHNIAVDHEAIYGAQGYLKTLTLGQQKLMIGVAELKLMYEERSVVIDNLCGDLKIHFSDYKVFKNDHAELAKEFKDFRWFRKTMNWLKDRSFWAIVVMGIILLFAAVFGIDTVWKVMTRISG
jgi:hypothetical protein